MSNKVHKNIKKPDQFQATVGEGFGWIQRHPKAMWTGVGSFLVLVISLGAWQFYQQGATETRRSELANIDKDFQKIQENHQKALEPLTQKINELEGKRDSDSVGKPTTGEAKIKIENEIADIKKKIEEQPIDYKKASEAYLKYYEKFPSYDDGFIAATTSASFLAQTEDFKAAEDLLQKITKNSNLQGIVRIQATILLSQIQEQTGRYDEALLTLEPVEKTAPKGFRPNILLSKARLNIALEKKDLAKADLEKIINDYKDSQEAQTARGIKAWLL